MARQKLGWPTFEEAKAMVRARDVISREDYWRWHKNDRIQFVPKYPNRVYDEWITWNDFLGTNNSFEGRHNNNLNAVDYYTAKQYLMKYGISSAEQYKSMRKNKEFDIDIPLTPEIFYDEWEGWNEFLGKTMSSRVQTQKEQIPVWAFVQMEYDPPNVLWFVKVENETELNRKVKEGWTIKSKYVYEANLEDQVWRIIEQHSAQFNEREQRLCSNINEMLFQLSGILLVRR